VRKWRHENSSMGSRRQRGKDPEEPAKHLVDPETVLEGSAKDQPGQKEKQDVWIGQGKAGEDQNSSRGSSRKRRRIRKIRQNIRWILKQF
jgi:hypothetical protein